MPVRCSLPIPHLAAASPAGPGRGGRAQRGAGRLQGAGAAAGPHQKGVAQHVGGTPMQHAGALVNQLVHSATSSLVAAHTSLQPAHACSVTPRSNRANVTSPPPPRMLLTHPCPSDHEERRGCAHDQRRGARPVCPRLRVLHSGMGGWLCPATKHSTVALGSMACCLQRSPNSPVPFSSLGSPGMLPLNCVPAGADAAQLGRGSGVQAAHHSAQRRGHSNHAHRCGGPLLGTLAWTSAVSCSCCCWPHRIPSELSVHPIA